MHVVRVLIVAAVCGCTAALAIPAPKNEKPPVEPLAHFRFDGNARNEVKGEAEFELKKTEFKDDALHLNGRYEGHDEVDGYRAVCKTPKLDYEKFSAALRFKAEEFGKGKSNLFTGGTSHRWFGLERSPGGNLVVTLNNGDFRKEVEGVALEKGKWTVVACSVDVPGRKVVVAVNGKKVADLDLPKDFELRVAKAKAKDTDKKWSFSNYSNGNVFHGLVDELLIYGRAMGVGELEKIPRRP